MAKPLFEQNVKDTAILLVDKSGSTNGSMMYKGVKLTIFERMHQVCKQLGYKKYRILFWNDHTNNSDGYVRGIKIIPPVVLAELLDGAFNSVKKDPGSGTETSIAFRAVPVQWHADNPDTYLITDGDCNSDRPPNVAQAIRDYPGNINIIAVENVKRDENSLEDMMKVPGGDIYRIISQEGLTGKVNKFIAYSIEDEFIQINKTKAPPGYAPYGDKYFSVFRTEEFMEYIKNELQQTQDTNVQLEIAQRLSSTIAVLTHDKPNSLVLQIINTFSRMFNIDHNMVNYIISNAVNAEKQGSARVISAYRAELKNLFAQADNLIKSDVRSAVGMNNEFISPVMDNRILTGPACLITSGVLIGKHLYPRSGFSKEVPVFPKLSKHIQLNQMQDQCLRQWIRCVYSAMYTINVMSDEIIYFVLAEMARVCYSDVSIDIKDAYRALAMCMLRKKRLNTVRTEYECLIAGEPPVPNSGRIMEFNQYMRDISLRLDMPYDPLDLWYKICYALDPALAAVQKRHCGDANAQLETKMASDVVQGSNAFDYTCLVTLDDTSATGGYIINQHVGVSGECYPMCVFSTEGYNQMIAGFCVCPVCYKRLQREDFSQVGPREQFDLPAGYKKYYENFTKQVLAQRNYDRDIDRSALPGAKNQGGICNVNGVKGKLILMRGTVGCGKTTSALVIQKTVEDRGGVCYVEGVDKYTSQGMPFNLSAGKVTEALRTISQCRNDDIVVIIDTCGDRPFKGTMFEVDFSGWEVHNVYPNYDKTDLKGYLAWSLYNVLNRPRPTPGCNFSLSPTIVGINKCRTIHQQKAKAVFPHMKNEWNFHKATLESLRPAANRYLSKLPPVRAPDFI